MYRLLWIVFISMVAAGCTPGSEVEETANTETPEPDPVEALQDKKADYDYRFRQADQSGELLVLVRLKDEPKLVEIQNEQWPDSIQTTYNILRDSLGRIILLGEFPESESGDWHIGYYHYFDKKGRTFAFERETNFFNSGCTEGVAYERIEKFYSEDFQLLDSAYRLQDVEARQLSRDSCDLRYDYPYQVYPDLNTLKRERNISPRDF